MRLIQYELAGRRRVGVEIDGEIFDAGYDEMLALINDGTDGLERARVSAGHGHPVVPDRIRAPLRNPGKIFGSGVNYRSHGDENPGFKFPDEPVWDFVKVASAIIGPTEAIVIPPTDDVIKRRAGHPAPFSDQGFAVDYEVEFGVVLGRTARKVRQADAMGHIFGYTVFNDVGARSVQLHNGQRDVAKNFDTFCPMGPCIVTTDELENWEGVKIRSWVNGELRQDAVVGDQICPPPAAIEWLSSVMTLHPGDCLMTGTPAGIGLFMRPPRFLRPGDVVTVSADAIGDLTNPVVG